MIFYYVEVLYRFSFLFCTLIKNSKAVAQGHNPLNTTFDPHELECDNVSSLSTDADSLKLKSNDVAFLRQRLRGMGRESRHNVISRRDNLMLSPDKPSGFEKEIVNNVQEVTLDRCKLNSPPYNYKSINRKSKNLNTILK